MPVNRLQHITQPASLLGGEAAVRRHGPFVEGAPESRHSFDPVEAVRAEGDERREGLGGKGSVDKKEADGFRSASVNQAEPVDACMEVA